MNILIIDAQGGGLGKQLISAIKASFPNETIIAAGTNNTATLAMLKGGADIAATGENAVIVACRKADIIIGPIGIVIADAMWGEITPKIATAVGQSDAKKLLMPINHCGNIIIGVTDLSITKLIQDMIKELQKLI